MIISTKRTQQNQLNFIFIRRFLIFDIMIPWRLNAIMFELKDKRMNDIISKILVWYEVFVLLKIY